MPPPKLLSHILMFRSTTRGFPAVRAANNPSSTLAFAQQVCISAAGVLPRGRTQLSLGGVGTYLARTRFSMPANQSPAAVFHCAMLTGSPINVGSAYRYVCPSLSPFIATVLIRNVTACSSIRPNYLEAPVHPQWGHFRITFPVRLSSQLSLHLILEVRPRDLGL
ncbi:hypothetical protein C8Q78DRAFT_1007984, partial [Trametes maxima]